MFATRFTVWHVHRKHLAANTCMTTRHAASRKLECALVRERRGQISFFVFIVKIAWPSEIPTVSGASSPCSGAAQTFPPPTVVAAASLAPTCLSSAGQCHPHKQGGQRRQPGTCRSLGFFSGPVSSSLNWGRQGTHHPGCVIKPVTCTMLRTLSGTQ